MKQFKPIIWGSAGAVGLFGLYFGILTLANSFSHAVEQFGQMWYWVILLAAGFGLQLGLYIHIRQRLRQKMKGATAEVATAGGISTGSMIACCAHHVTDVLPLLGLTAAAMFLVNYQVPFILLGIFSNLVGITIMLTLLQKHNLWGDSSILQSLARLNMKTVRNGAIGASVVIVATSFLVTGLQGGESQKVSGQTFELPPRVNQENYVAIEVTPMEFSFTNPSVFKIALNTHRGSLDYDLADITTLVCDRGNEYTPVRWEGTPPGGHHRSGKLTFPALNHEASHLTLTIRGVYDVPKRAFQWDI